MIQFKKYKRVPGSFSESYAQQMEEPTEFTTRRVEVEGAYWVSDGGPFEISFCGPDTRFSLRSATAIPMPPTQVEILTELQKLTSMNILYGGRVKLDIAWHRIPDELQEFLSHENDTVYLPT